MKWQQYETDFTSEARRVGLSADAISACLTYAKRLFDRHLPIIYDQRHLALLLGYDQRFLLSASNAPHKFYRTFTIPKKAGGAREIAEPLPSLKEVQRWILDNILYTQQPSAFAKAFIPRRSIRHNARFHVHRKVVLTLDITDFFGSIRYRSVFALFRRLGYTSSVSTLLANLCCLHGVLPQGAPTSPAISNLVFKPFDQSISSYCLLRNIHYTRYSDDMTFSGDFSPGKVIRFVRKVLSEKHLTINQRKIQVREPHQRQEVTGIVVNAKLQAPRTLRRKLRQCVHFITKYGISSHLEHTENERANHVRHLIGLADFIIFVNPSDQEAAGYKQILLNYLPENT